MAVCEAVRPGTVYLVGAGPGDPGLITVRGLACLRRAEVVVYDRLVCRELLREAPAAAERLYAGKALGRCALSQERINALLIERARAGRVVVRLKGGDPFVFGRGGEEAAACAEAGVPWEVVPGVTSAVGVPGRAAIPLTHRGLAASLAVVTAHRAADLEDLPWEALACLDTLVVLMGVGRLYHVVTRLLSCGKPPGTPAAVIEKGTLPGERVITAPLEELPARARDAGIRAPATIVVGDVVALRGLLALTGLGAQVSRPPAVVHPLRSTAAAAR